MIFASSHLADALPPSAFKCSVTGTCTATNPGYFALFVALQNEMNRVRKVYGLPADVTVDGKIGSKTVAKLMKLAQRIASTVPGQQLDSTIEGYVIEVAGQLPSSAQVARDAADLVAALKRNGYGPGYVPPTVQSDALIDPYLVSGGNIRRPNIPGTLVVGPTASAGGGIVPGGYAPPGAHVAPVGPILPGVPKGLKIAGVIAGLLGIAGLGVAAWKASQV